MDDFDPKRDYPLGTNRPDLVRTPSGRSLEDLTLAALRRGDIAAGDLRATPATLRRQASVAGSSGRAQLAANLGRAAELTAVPDDVVLLVYTALRPGRSTAEELEVWATTLESEYGARTTAALVREARAVYAERGLLA